jgi:very-short-patch-repair endonuclease
MVWRAERLIVEIDGFEYHRSREAFERDRLRDARLQAAGNRVVRITRRQISQQPEAVVARGGHGASDRCRSRPGSSTVKQTTSP